MHNASLLLENGARFNGLAPLWQSGPRFGEVVFTTGMTGYTESLTDPSYAGQILVFTYPLIGNYGIFKSDSWESKKIHARGVIVSECAPFFSHFKSETSLFKWLEKENVFLLTGVDTRALTKLLRENGTFLGVIDKNPSVELFKKPKEISTKAPLKDIQISGKGAKRVIAVDAGMKESMMRQLLRFPIEIKRVPSSYDYSDEDFDAVFLSNGPGDPTEYGEEIEILKKAMKRKKPIFGVCLGCQVMAIASGAKTYKLKYGHRGQNQPCIHEETEKCFITSQNHGYAVDKNTLSKGWKVTFRNLNDGSVEGIAHEKDPFFAVQFHPEASPGPTDTHFLFEKFYELI